uniref:Polyamine-modulated factor 1 n=1 Tax=Salvator merianae TaxID=96440 RepID=A0A8D0DVN9_SALMN
KARFSAGGHCAARHSLAAVGPAPLPIGCHDEAAGWLNEEQLFLAAQDGGGGGRALQLLLSSGAREEPRPGGARGLHRRPFPQEGHGGRREEIQELKDEGNLTELLGSLDKLVEEAKQRELPAWRPSGLPEEDVRSAVVPYFLKQRKYLQKALKEREEGNATLARAVLAGREKIADLHEEIRRRKEEWQATVREGREIVNTLDELP